MKLTMTILAGLVMAAGSPALAAEKPADAPTTPQAVATGSNEFAVALYGRLAEKPGNVFFSPSSIHTALTMTAEGAQGTTWRQMWEVLHWPTHTFVGHLREQESPKAHSIDMITQPVPDLSQAYKGLLEKLKPGKDAGYRLHVANALWGQQGAPWLPAFLAATKDDYGAGLREVNFAGAAEDARKTINAWVEKQTQEKIKDLLAPGVLTTQTRLVLTNAIYFKGDWAEQFNKKLTKDAPFHVTGGKDVQAPLMSRLGTFGYAQDEVVQVVSMPYKGKELSMVVLLPQAIEGLGAFEKTLTPKGLQGLLERLRETKVHVFLPRFKATCEFELSKELKAMGMTDAFSDAADFSRMNGKKDLFISAVVHKAFVDVNEEGTEAAAATGVVVRAKNGHGGPPIPVFRADHPFLYLIRHNATGAILFMGRLADPKP